MYGQCAVAALKWADAAIPIPVFQQCGTIRRPRSAASSPRIAAMRLDLPEPLAPVIPTLLPRNTVKLTCSNSGSGPRRRVRSRADNTVDCYEDSRIDRNTVGTHNVA